jgi:3-oxoacyl-[acyl-carrier-protein] synthase II
VNDLASGTPPAPPAPASRRRVVVTGVGAVTALGPDLAATVRALSRGETAGGAALPPALPGAAAGEPGELGAERAGVNALVATVPGLDVRRHFRTPKALKVCDRRTRLAVAAAAMALADAGLADGAEQADWGVVLGTSGSDPGAEDLADALAGDAGERSASDIPFFAERILSRLHPLWLVVQLPNMTSAHVAIQFGLQGPNSTVMTDWVAGTQAIGEAFLWVQQGEADVVLAGGADVGTTLLSQVSYRQCGLFASPPGSAPPLAEGAAVLVLEERERARRRGAAILGEIVGYASAAELAASPDEASGVAGAGVARETAAVTAAEVTAAAAEAADDTAAASQAAAGSALARAASQALAAAGWESGSVSWLISGGAASAARWRLEESALASIGCALGGWFDPAARLGHALAAQGPIALALALFRGEGAALPGDSGAAEGPGARLLCSGRGLLGQAAVLAIAAGGDGAPPWWGGGRSSWLGGGGTPPWCGSVGTPPSRSVGAASPAVEGTSA